MSGSLPTLWQIDISHYSEKARWALDFKGVEYERRAPLPGAHIAVAMWLTRGRHKTFPVLELERRSIGDSTAVIAALEQRFPEPPLYPADPQRRRRALELEDFFDEELGPHVRHLAFHEMRNDPERLRVVAQRAAPAPLDRLGGVSAAYARAYTSVRWSAGDEKAAEVDRLKIVAAVDRLEQELGSDEYLVGDRFSVADLTAASLLYPVVLPAEGPSGEEGLSKGMRRFRESLAGRDGFGWVAEMFRRHRRPARAAVPA
jgi:glutathione S-transferase